MDWKKLFNDVSQSVTDSLEKESNKIKEEQGYVRAMSDDRLIKEIRNGGGSWERRSIMMQEAKKRGLMRE